MQQFIRTINTTDAFKMKMEQLEREYQSKLQHLNTEITRLDAEKNRYAVKGVGGELGGGFLRFISWIAFILGTIAMLLSILAVYVDGIDEMRKNLPIFIAIVLFGIFMLILGGVWRSKANRMLRRAYAKQQAAQAAIDTLEQEIELLSGKREQLEVHYHAEMTKQKSIFQQHMLNQQELIEQEVSAIQLTKSLSTASVDDMQECPKCAETIKRKAILCRYCGYSFEK